MNAAPTDLEPIVVYVDADGTTWLENAWWPQQAQISDAFVRMAPRAVMELRYPYLAIRLVNATAVYQVETLDQGLWDATLVEGRILTQEKTAP